MPNWCINTISISSDGDDNKFIEFLAKLKKRKDSSFMFSFNDHVPIPEIENVDQCIEWNIKNWGTKWDGNDSTIDFIDNILHIQTTTPYGPPIIWAKNVATKFSVKISLRYQEEELSYAGYCSISNGNVQEKQWDTLISFT